ncbi:hypothetical protein A5893_00075 [Pedobacter psychrophilus]|uniref:Carboxypeptidase-like regulatory domain-containing protein n=1 Tax=Pedobacter psychrophilus TaxID=1826909 RepID=A0A179DLZ6_9SPHI|nr:carboxypeptidase-like regulatory domain-containing protein [Pedobacter psychrophilus]OAQ41549.1 hypothetical protein A5893_00075 [Pedobacter psychrophilus]
MRIIPLMILFLIGVVSTDCFAQQKISGQILDSLNSKPIAYAVIQVSKNTVISNSEGNFELNIKEDKNDSLILSCFGYQLKKYSFKELSKQNQKFYLSPQSIILIEVTVKPITIKELLILATKTSSEKFNSPVLLSGYYREVVKRDSLISKYSDGLLNYFIEKDKKGKTDITVKIDQSRVKEVDLKEEDDKIDALNSKIPVTLLPSYIRPNLLSILDSNNFKNYNFKLVEIEGAQPLYKITFKPQLEAKVPLNEGVIYIDKETNLILEMEAKFCPTPNVPFFKTVSMLGITVNVTDRNLYVKYKHIDDNYYPLYSQFGIKVSIASKRVNQTSELRSEFLATDYQNKSVIKPNTNVFNKLYLYKNGSNFTYNFWESMISTLNSKEELLFLKE